MPHATFDDLMATFARDAVAGARASHDVELDYSPKSVEQVEQILGSVHRSIPSGVRSLIRKGPSETQISLLAKVFGGYLGEVIRRTYGGEWTVEGDGATPAAFTLAVRGTIVSPVERAYGRIVNGPQDNVWEFFRTLAGELESKAKQ